MPQQIQALFFGLGIAGVIAIVLLVFGERPELAAAVRRWIGGEAGPASRSVPSPQGDGIMSSGASDADDLAPEDPADAPATTTPQHDNNAVAISDNERNALLFAGAADALAAMVAAGKVTQTDGIRIVYGVGPSSTNKTYLAARELLLARLERLQAPQPGQPKPLTAEQHAARVALGLQEK